MLIPNIQLLEFGKEFWAESGLYGLLKGASSERWGSAEENHFHWSACTMQTDLKI